ncbi:DUF916 domain-containing protein [Vibrio sp. MMG022]|uniref:fimbrial biogenesis chaperone n=1 Tax=Vibrio sp. MMG023 TaxID=2909979 RepID=UPI001F193948|nr:DUF916 domain-containing protein [Vibrio sp. MMG023]MCF6452862.1 DUF916 domain-containing protein [Vibrio sp. MMG023]
MKHLVLLLTTIFVSFPSYAQLLIAPTRLVLNADQSVTEKIIVENNSDKPIRLEIKPVYRPITSRGVTRTDKDIAQTEDIAKWIKVSPPIIRELKPNQRRTIRLRFSALPADKDNGEYRAYLWFSPITLVQSQTADAQSSGPSFALDFRVNSYIPVYAQRGEVQQDVSIQCKQGELRIQNKGRYQFNAMLNTDNHQERLVLLRQSELVKRLPAKSKILIIQDEQSLHECTL